MKRLQLTVFSLCLTGLAIFTSCESDREWSNKPFEHEKGDIAVTGAQVVPATNSPATGTLWVSYNEKKQLLDYELTWGGLRDTIREINFYEGPVSYPSLIAPVQKIAAFNASNLRANQTAYPFIGGKYRGAAIIDGVVFTKEKLLNHLYYIQILTKQFPNGEIRAQVRFR